MSKFWSSGPDYEALRKSLESKDQAEVDAALEQLNQIDEKMFDGLSDDARIELVGALERLRERGMEAAEGSVEARVAEAVDKKLIEVDKGQAYKSLPPELKQRVIAHLDSKTHGALAQTSKDNRELVREVQRVTGPYSYSLKASERESFSKDPQLLKAFLEENPKLERLDLSQSPLSVDHFEILSQYGKNLVKLNLRFTQLGGVVGSRAPDPDALKTLLTGCPNLKVLNLSNNLLGAGHIKILQEHGRNLESLSLVSAFSSQVSDGRAEAISALCDYLRSDAVSNLKALHIGARRTFPYDGLIASLNESKQLGSLTELHLPGFSGYTLVDQLKGAPNLCARLRYLDLNGCEMGDEKAQEFATINFPKLQKLDLGWNTLTGWGLNSISEAAYFKNLITLSIESAKLDTGGNPAIFLEKLGDLSGLVSLNLSNVSIVYLSEERFGMLTEALGKMTNLARLDLSSCALRRTYDDQESVENSATERMIALLGSVGSQSQITDLNLRMNNLGYQNQDMLKGLFEKIAGMEGLKRLDMGDNSLDRISEEGLVALIDGLKALPQLQFVDFSPSMPYLAVLNSEKQERVREALPGCEIIFD